MIKSIIVISFLLFGGVSTAQNNLVFESNFVLTEVLAKSLNTNGYIFIYVYGDDAFSRAYASTHFNNDKICKILGKFRLLKTSPNDLNFEQIKLAYNISTTPSFVLLNGQNQVLKKISGYHNQSDFLVYLQDAISDDKSNVRLQELINQGIDEPELLFEYCKSQQIGGDDFGSKLEMLFEKVPQDFGNPIYFESVLRFDNDFSSERFQNLLLTLHQFDHVTLQKDFINDKISESIASYILQLKVKSPELIVTDTIQGICKAYNIDFFDLINAKVNYRLGEKNKKKTDAFYDVWVYMAVHGYNFRDDNYLIYFSLVSFIENAKSESQISNGFKVVNEMLVRTSRPEYKYLYIRLLIKAGMVQEFDESFEVLKKLNSRVNFYSPREILDIEKEINKAKKEYANKKSKSSTGKK